MDVHVVDEKLEGPLGVFDWRLALTFGSKHRSRHSIGDEAIERGSTA